MIPLVLHYFSMLTHLHNVETGAPDFDLELTFQSRLVIIVADIYEQDNQKLCRLAE